MNIFTMMAVFSLLILALGALIMWLVVTLSNSVVENSALIAREERVRKSVNPATTAGYEITAAKQLDDKLVEARKLAAKQAAKVARGANMGIGRLGTADVDVREFSSTGAAVDDPMTAVKIAEHHTWSGLEYRSPSPVAAGAAAPVATGGSQTMVKRKLVPGTDFEWVDFKGLSGGAKRTAIIANAKAKSEAYKALKASGQTMVAQATAPVASAQAAETPAAAAPTGLPPAPVYVEITDSMPNDEKRAAKIANAKTKSAYNKQLKAMGIDPKSVGKAGAPAPVVQENVATAVESAPTPQATSSDVPPPPELVEITDAMSNDEIRAARIANAKTKSAYKKELKAMGIDPKTVKI